MKRLIYQVSIGKNQVYDLCNESVRKYAEYHDVDYYVQTEPILKIGPFSDLKVGKKHEKLFSKYECIPHLEKFNAIQKLNEYDQVAVIDADVFVKKNSENIFDELNNEYDMAACNLKDYNMSIKLLDTSNFYTMGVILFNKTSQNYIECDALKEFLTQEKYKNYINGVDKFDRYFDSLIFNHWIHESKIKIFDLNVKWNALMKHLSKSKIIDSYFYHFNGNIHRHENPRYLQKVNRIIDL